MICDFIFYICNALFIIYFEPNTHKAYQLPLCSPSPLQWIRFLLVCRCNTYQAPFLRHMRRRSICCCELNEMSFICQAFCEFVKYQWTIYAQQPVLITIYQSSKRNHFIQERSSVYIFRMYTFPTWKAMSYAHSHLVYLQKFI